MKVTESIKPGDWLIWGKRGRLGGVRCTAVEVGTTPDGIPAIRAETFMPGGREEFCRPASEFYLADEQPAPPAEPPAA